MTMSRGSIVRISSLLLADTLVGYAFFVLQNYLTDVWGLSFTHAAGIVNLWNGTCLILPVFFLFLVDTFMGNFFMLVLSSSAFSVGIAFVWMSTPPVLAKSTHTCKQYDSKCIGEVQKVLFYIGIALVAVGVAGHQVSVRPFLEEQDNKPDNKNPWQILGYFLVVIVTLSGAIAIPHIKPWSIRFGIPALLTVLGTLLFLTGFCWCRYTTLKAQGSPVTRVVRVFVAFARKMFRKYPLDDRKLYRGEDEEPISPTHTRFLRCLEKAAIDENPDNTVKNRWKLCTIAEVEEAKIAVRMIPMWLTFVVCGIVSSTGTTYFVEQANHMNRKVGSWRIPAPVLLLLYKRAKWAFQKISKPFLSKYKIYGPPMGIGVAMVFSILCCITAARFEAQRLKVMRHHGLSASHVKEIPMSMFLLLPQYFLLAGLDAFMESSVIAFYAHQSPNTMENYLQHFTKCVSGLGFMSSMLMVYTVRTVRPNWFRFLLNMSRLDQYYWVLAAVSFGNLVFYILVALLYRYKNLEAGDDFATGNVPLDDGDGCAFF